MHLLWFLSLSAGFALAQDLPQVQRSLLHHLRRRDPAIIYSNTTTTSSSSADTTSASSIGSSSSISTTSTILALPFFFPNATTSSSTNLTTGIFANTSTTEEPTCTGSVTYYGSVPPTVYITVTEGFDVTITASNISVTERPTLITPLPACERTIIPAPLVPELTATLALPSISFAPEEPGASPEGGSRTGGAVPEIATAAPPRVPLAPPALPPPAPAASEGSTATEANSGIPLSPQLSSAVYSSVDYTSTVVVTKKTPVPVVAPPTTSPNVDFQNTSPTPTPSANAGGGSAGNTDNPPLSPPRKTDIPAPGSPGKSSSPSPTAKTVPTVGKTGPTAGTLVAGEPGTTTGLGDIIASIINVPFASPSPAVRLSSTTTLNNVPVVINPSNVVIGTHTVAIPTSASTTIKQDGVEFTVGPSEIVAPAGTITISPTEQNQQIVTPRPATTTVTAGGQVITVGQTVAIISGTTYRIGEGAPATTITVDGSKISIGAGGVGLPSTTVLPGGSPFVVVTAEGLTFSVDGSEAVLSGTTYRIGSKAQQITATVAGHSISFGSGGVGLRSTTIRPTAPATSTAKAGTSATSAGAAATGTSAAKSNAWVTGPIPFSELLGWYLMAVPAILFIF